MEYGDYTLYRRFSKKKGKHVYYVQFYNGEGERLSGWSSGETSQSTARGWAREQIAKGGVVSEMKLHWNSLFAKTTLSKKFTAVTFGQHVFIKAVQTDLPAVGVERLLKHEGKHVEQYEKYGFFGFLIRYLWYSIKHGYYNNPLEIEARKAEGRAYQ
jgi:hypothetical protein